MTEPVSDEVRALHVEALLEGRAVLKCSGYGVHYCGRHYKSYVSIENSSVIYCVTGLCPECSLIRFKSGYVNHLTDTDRDKVVEILRAHLNDYVKLHKCTECGHLHGG
jgi:hypothetical protein